MSNRRKANSRRPGIPAPEPTDDRAVWIRTEPSPDGATYLLVLELDADTAVTLTPDAAVTYAAAVTRLGMTAAHDAAVYLSLFDRVHDQAAAFQVVRDLRNDRPAVDTGTPLHLTPGLNLKGEPFLALEVNDQAAGQWEVAATLQHAAGVLQALAVADLDAAYYRTLRGMVGLDEPVARAAVADLYGKLRELTA